MSTLISRLYNFVTDKANNVKITASRMDAENNQIIVALNRKVLCSASAPSSPIAGQTWVDTTNKFLKLYRNGEWVIQGIVHVGTSAPETPQLGDCWVDTTNKSLSFYDGSRQVVVSSPVGIIQMWPTTSAPIGYLLCDGTAVSRTTYAALFAVIGTTYGVGDASTTFNVPNAKGKFPVGYNASETEFDAMGDTGGAKTINLQHNHGGVTAVQSGVVNGTGFAIGAADKDHVHAISNDLSATQSILVPYIVFNYIIKT